MRSSLTRALVGATAIAGIAAGSLMGASTGFAAPPAVAKPAASIPYVSPLAVNNLGLSTARAKNWQCWLKTLKYSPGTIDGQLGTSSWKAAQKLFGFKAGAVDGIVGPNTIKALQSYLNSWGYNLAVDGVAGTKTEAAFSDFNATGC